MEAKLTLMMVFKLLSCPKSSDNDVDGETFLLLEEADIISMVPSIGARRKIIAKRRDSWSLATRD